MLLFELDCFSVGLKSGFAAQADWFAVVNLNFFTRGVVTHKSKSCPKEKAECCALTRQTEADDGRLE